MTISYLGGKGAPGVYQWLINEMPPHSFYVEPFAGGGAVLRHKRPAARSVAIDTNASSLAALVATIAANHGASTRLSTSAAVPSGSPVSTIDAGGHRYEFRCGDGLAQLSTSGGALPADALSYADPPYLMATRSSQRCYYGAEHEPGAQGRAEDEAWHASLLAVLQALPCRVMVSGYWSGLYAEALRDWRAVGHVTRNRAGDWVQEWVWCNFPEAVRLHDYSHLGDDYRERERIRRKIERWRRKLADMPVLERRAIMAALSEIE